MRGPYWLKSYKFKTKDRRGRHTKAERLAKIRAAKASIVKPSCRECCAVLDPAARTEEGDAIVCTSCGLVDNNICFDHEAPIYDYVPRNSLYRHRNYFAEKIRQARNTEPRLAESELDAMSIIYDIYQRHSPVLWSEGMFTKKHAKRICRIIKKQYPDTQWHSRHERWFQYRTYICGDMGLSLPQSVASQLRILFDAYAYYFLKYLEINNMPRHNIAKLDLLILVLLYNISYQCLSEHGWYFLNKNIMNRSRATIKDINEIRTICRLVNEKILSLKDVHMVDPECLRWFRAGNKLVVPKLDILLNFTMNHPMGYVKFVSYYGSSHLTLLSHLSLL